MENSNHVDHSEAGDTDVNEGQCEWTARGFKISSQSVTVINNNYYRNLYYDSSFHDNFNNISGTSTNIAIGDIGNNGCMVNTLFNLFHYIFIIWNTVIQGQKIKPGLHEVILLKVWKRGFSVDNGPLRELNDPDNKEFLEDLFQG